MNFKKEQRLNESVESDKKQLAYITELITPGQAAILSYVADCKEVSESVLSKFIDGINESTNIAWVREKGLLFEMKKKNNQFFVSLSETGQKVLKESSLKESVELSIISEAKMTIVKRKYGAAPAQKVQEKTKIRNKVLSFIAENGAVTKTAFVEYLKQMNEESGSKTTFRWVKRNSQFFKVSEDKVSGEKTFTLSALGKRVLSRTSVNESVTVEEILNEDYSESLITAVAKDLGVDISNYDMNQLKIGMEVELMAHGTNAGDEADITANDPVATMQLVIGNLKLDSKYYTKAKPENWGEEFFKSSVTGEDDIEDIIAAETGDETADSDEGDETADSQGEIVKGGRADGKTIADIAKKHSVSEDTIVKEYKVGCLVELEHTNSKDAAGEIARDHLLEDPRYYTNMVKAGLVDEEDALKLAKDLLDVEPANNKGTEDKGTEDKGTEDKGTEDKGTEDKGTEDKDTEDKGTEDKDTEDQSAKLLSSDQKNKLKELLKSDELDDDKIKELSDEWKIDFTDLKSYIEILKTNDSEETDKTNANESTSIDEKSNTGISADAKEKIISIAMQFSDDENINAAIDKSFTDCKQLVDYLKEFIKPRDTKRFIGAVNVYAKQNNLPVVETEEFVTDAIKPAFIDLELGESYAFTKGTGTIVATYDQSLIVEWEDGSQEELHNKDITVSETDAATVYNVPGMGDVSLPGPDEVGSGDTFDNPIPANAGLNRKQGRYKTNQLFTLDNFVKNSLQESK